MSLEFDLRKDSHSIQFEQRPQIFVKISFTEFGDSKLSGLDSLNNMPINHELKTGQNRKSGCEFTRHQSLK